MSDEFCVGMRVRVLSGLPAHWGQPIGVIRSIGTKLIRVELFHDETDHYFAPDQLCQRPTPSHDRD